MTDVTDIRLRQSGLVVSHMAVETMTNTLGADFIPGMAREQDA